MPPDDNKQQGLLMMLDARMRAKGAKTGGFDEMFHPEDYTGGLPTKPKKARRPAPAAPDMSASDDALMGKLQDAAIYGIPAPGANAITAQQLGLTLTPQHGLPFSGVDSSRLNPDDMELLQDYLRRHAPTAIAAQPGTFDYGNALKQPGNR